MADAHRIEEQARDYDVDLTSISADNASLVDLDTRRRVTFQQSCDGLEIYLES